MLLRDCILMNVRNFASLSAAWSLAARTTGWPWSTVFDQICLLLLAQDYSFWQNKVLLYDSYLYYLLLISVSVHISLYFTLQWSDNRHSFRCPSWLDFLSGAVFPRCAVPSRPGHPPQESHEEVPGKRRGGTSETIHLVSCFGCYMHLFSSGKYSCVFGRALSHWVLGRKVPRFTPASWGPQSWRNLNPLALEFLAQWTRYLLTSLCLWTSTINQFMRCYSFRFNVLDNFHRLMSTDATALYI